MEHVIIEEIRSIKGDTLGDIFKKFSLYVIDNNDVIASSIDEILASFIPENNLHRLFRLSLIDKFQKTSEIRRILEGEDIFYTIRALNCKWFFTNLEVNPTILVNEVLPILSYSIRYKLIKKYSKYLKDVNKAEEMYRALQQRYGIGCAINILPACSPTFIKATLCTSIGQIKPIIIEPLFRKFPDVVVDFFSLILNSKSSRNRLYRSFNFDKYSNVFVKIASKFPERFIDMYAQHGEHFPYMTLGNRTAKRVIQTNPSVIIVQWDSFKKILKLKQTKKYMDASQIEDLQLSYFPEKLMEFFDAHWKMGEIKSITSHLGEEMGQEIFLRNFKKRYNRELNIDEFAKVMSLSLVQLIPIEMRIKWVQRELPSLETDNKKAEYLSYLPPDIALPALKEMIKKQNDFLARAHMVKCMMISSGSYKNTTSLVDCLSYVLRRLRNDNIRIRENVFNELINWKELLRSLTIEEWSVIDELIDLVRMNDEEMNFKYYICELFSLKINIYFSKGIPVEEHLQKFFDFVASFGTVLTFELCKGTIYRKKCLEFFLRSYPSVSIKKEEDKAYSEVTLFCALCEYNHLYSNDQLQYPEWLLVSIEKILLSNLHYYNKSSLIKAIRKQPHLKDRLYLKSFPHFIDLNSVLYLLHKRPLVIKEHNEKLMKHVLNLYPYTMQEYITFFKQITLYTTFNLLQTQLNFCISLLQADEPLDSEDCYSKQNAVTVLAVFMPAEDFIEVISPFKPTKEELENYTDENRLQYRIQQSVAASFKFVNTPSKILAYVKTFAVGDYLKLVLGSINSISLKVTEKKILPVLIEWLDCRVSLRKHFIRAFYKIAPVADSGKLIVSLLSKEKNVSLRLLLLEHIYKFFQAEPSEESFAVFKAGYSQLTPEDVAAVDKLFDLKSIPNSFVPLFVKMLWEAVELKEGLLVAKNKNKIINMLDADILSLLPEEFCDVLLKHAFSSVSSTENKTLIALYLLHASDEHSQMCRLEKFFLNLKPILEQDWNDFDLNRMAVFQTRDNVFNLIEDICVRSIKKEILQVNPMRLLEKLKSFVLSLVSASDIVEQLLRLDISIFITANSSQNDNFVTQLAKFYEEKLIKEVSTYGDQIIETMFHVMPYYLEPYRLKLAKILLCEHTSYQVHLFALKLINTNINEDLTTYKIIVDFLLKCDHPFVKAAAGGFLRNLTSNVHVN